MKILTNTTFLVSLLCGFSCIHSMVHADSRIVQTDSMAAQHQQYHKSEWEIQLVAHWQNSPHRIEEVILDMQLTAPSGKVITLPCYYEHGQSEDLSFWRARFTPTESGIYKYDFQLKEAGILKSQSEVRSFSVQPSDGTEKGFLQSADNWKFEFSDGSPFRGIGYNIGWEARTHDDSRFFSELHENPRHNYAAMLKTLHESGGNFFRTWMIYWNLPVDWKQISNSRRYENSPKDFNPSGSGRMEQLIKLCEGYDAYFMVSIDTHGTLTGRGWKQSKYNSINGGPAADPQDFFTNPAAKILYKSKLRYLVARWGYSSRIAVWEFFNEVDNVMYAHELDSTIPDSIVAAWHQEMTDYLTDIDPYDHLISTSVSHRDVKGINLIENMDFNQKHIYRNTHVIPSTLVSYIEATQKPYVIGEFSYEWDWSKNFDDFTPEMEWDFKTGLWYGLFNPTPILPMSWWWEYFQKHGTVTYLKHLKQVNQSMLMDLENVNEFEAVSLFLENADTRAFAVQAGEALYLYVENSNNAPATTQIQFSQLPEKLTGTIDSQCYDFEKTQFVDIEPNNTGALTTVLNLKLDACQMKILRFIP